MCCAYRKLFFWVFVYGEQYFVITLFRVFKCLDKVLNDMMKNEKTEIRKLAIPIIEELTGKMIIEMINRVFSSLPVDELFLPE